MIAHRIRLLFTVSIVLLTGISAAAQEGPRAEPRTINMLSDGFAGGNVTKINMPDAVDGFDMFSATVETGEPGASCTSGVLSHTVWFSVTHPGGTLDIDTSYSTGTGFDSVVQLFRADTGLLRNLVEVGCDDNSGGGSSGNDAQLVMTHLSSDVYLARISCITLCGGTNDLALAVSYTPDETPPANDSINKAKALKIGKVVKTKNAEHTTEAPAEETQLPGCAMYNTVWFTMIVPVTGSYGFSTFGSVLNRPDEHQADTKIAVYRSADGPIFSNFTSLGCNDDYGTLGYGALTSLTLQAGDEIYVRIGTFSSRNLMDGSTYKLKTTVVSLPNVLTNNGFETGTLAPWKMKITNALDGVTDTYALLGSSARMVGEPGKKNSLKQSWVPADFGIILPKNGTVHASFYYSTNGTTSSKASAKLKIAYSNGAPPTVTKIDLHTATNANGFRNFSFLAPITQPKVASISLKIQNKSPGGFVFIDTTQMSIYGDPARDAKSPAGILPPPAAPAGMRGTN